MPISILDVGTNFNDSGGPSIAVNATIPAGSVIGVCVHEQTGSAIGALSDGLNTYKIPASISFTDGIGGFSAGIVYYAWNSVALNSTNITYTKLSAANGAAMSVFYITGARVDNDPLDTVITATNSGTSVNPNVTSGGIPSYTFEAYIGVVFVRGAASDIFTQASNWATPPTAVFATGGTIVAGGSLINPLKSVLPYSPTFDNSRVWGAIMVGFMPPPPTSLLIPQAFM